MITGKQYLTAGRDPQNSLHILCHLQLNGEYIISAILLSYNWMQLDV